MAGRERLLTEAGMDGQRPLWARRGAVLTPTTTIIRVGAALANSPVSLPRQCDFVPVLSVAGVICTDLAGATCTLVHAAHLVSDRGAAHAREGAASAVASLARARAKQGDGRAAFGHLPPNRLLLGRFRPARLHAAEGVGLSGASDAARRSSRVLRDAAGVSGAGRLRRVPSTLGQALRARRGARLLPAAAAAVLQPANAASGNAQAKRTDDAAAVLDAGQNGADDFHADDLKSRHPPGEYRERVTQEVHVAALPSSFGGQLGDGLAQAAVVVRDNELEAVQAAVLATGENKVHRRPWAGPPI